MYLQVNSLILAASNTVLLGADPARYVLQNFTISGTVVVVSMMDTEKALEFARRVGAVLFRTVVFVLKN